MLGGALRVAHSFRALRFAALFALSAATAFGFVWPNVAEQIEKELAKPDVAARRRAAQRLDELPVAVAKRLIPRALADADVEVRLAAADAVLELGLSGVGDGVVAWLSDPERRIRLAAAEVLSQSPTPRAIAPLGRLLGDPDADVRSAAAAALGTSQNPEATLPLLGHLDDNAPEVRRAVVSALARLGDRKSVVPLIGKIQDPRDLVRRAVARALGELGDTRAVSALVLALRDNDESVRIAALQALGTLRDDGATLSIVSLLEQESREAVRGAALDGLAAIGSPRSLDALVGALASERLEPSRALVRKALVRAGPPAVQRLLRCLAGQPARGLADGCALALGEIGAGKAAPVVAEAMRRGAVSARAGLRSLELLGEPSVLPAVLEHLGDADPFVRRAAVDATAALLDPERPDGRAVDPIVRAMRATRTSRAERTALVALLGRTGSPRSRAALEPLAAEAEDLELKLAAIESLGLIGPAGQDGVLLAALDDERVSVRLAAALALRRSASGGAVRALLDRLDLGAEQDRVALALALAGGLERSSDSAQVGRAERLLAKSRGAERDALIEALGRAPGPLGSQRLIKLAERSGTVADRAKIAEALAFHPEATEALCRLAKDVDGAVRANAVWALGAVAGSDRVALLAAALADRDVAVAGNAAAALGRVAQRIKVSIEAPLCKALADPRSYVRANALAALRIGKMRCSSDRARTLVERDRSEVVRAAAARLLHSVPSAERGADRAALERCAAEDPSGLSAAACSRAPDPLTSGSASVTVFVVPIGESEPVPLAPFALVRADGLMRLGVADRRGAVFENAAPRGFVSLAVPAPLAGE